MKDVQMQETATERRSRPRYDVQMPLRYHFSRRGNMPRSGTGLTREMSSTGLSFHCRKPLPVGAHVVIVIDWPAKYDDLYPVDLQMTGFVLRSQPGRTAVKITSHRFRVDPVRVETRVSA